MHPSIWAGGVSYAVYFFPTHMLIGHKLIHSPIEAWGGEEGGVCFASIWYALRLDGIIIVIPCQVSSLLHGVGQTGKPEFRRVGKGGRGRCGTQDSARA
jgi:hypothetical protein